MNRFPSGFRIASVVRAPSSIFLALYRNTNCSPVSPDVFHAPAVSHFLGPKALLHDSLAELEDVRPVVVAGDVESHALLGDPPEVEIGDQDLLAVEDGACE